MHVGRLLAHALVTLICAAGFAVFASCASAPFRPDKAQTATVDKLRRLGSANNGVDVLIYKGSDAQFHYFHHSQLGGGGSYRLPRGEWIPPQVRPLDQAGGTTPKFPPAVPRP